MVGVAHIKAYAFDDNVLLSGANLSNTYFSMRQDRYYLFRDAPVLAQHIRSLVQAGRILHSARSRKPASACACPCNPLHVAPSSVICPPQTSCMGCA